MRILEDVRTTPTVTAVSTEQVKADMPKPRMAFKAKSIQHFHKNYEPAARYHTPVFRRAGKAAGLVVVARDVTRDSAAHAYARARAAQGFGMQPTPVLKPDTKKTSTPTR